MKQIKIVTLFQRCFYKKTGSMRKQIFHFIEIYNYIFFHSHIFLEFIAGKFEKLSGGCKASYEVIFERQICKRKIRWSKWLNEKIEVNRMIDETKRQK